MGENVNKVFPDYYPDSCPPINKAIKGGLKVYRMVESNKSNNIKRREFVASGVRRALYESVSCNKLALSLLSNPDDAHVALKYFSSIGMAKKNKVAVGHITEESGIYARYPSENVGDSHVNWWTYKGIEPHTYFNEVLIIGVDI